MHVPGTGFDFHIHVLGGNPHMLSLECDSLQRGGLIKETKVVRPSMCIREQCQVSDPQLLSLQECGQIKFFFRVTSRFI